MQYSQIQDDDEGASFLTEKMKEVGHKGPFYRAIIPTSKDGPYILKKDAYDNWKRYRGSCNENNIKVVVYRWSSSPLTFPLSKLTYELRSVGDIIEVIPLDN